MQTNWRITNGRIIDPANGVDQTGDLLIIAGRIASPGQEAPPDTTEIDAAGCWVVDDLVAASGTSLRRIFADYPYDVP